MCGIFGVLFDSNPSDGSIVESYGSFWEFRHRGPDNFDFKGIAKINGVIGMHRLAIRDTSTRGDQPFYSESKGRTIVMHCNGEIYNHKELQAKYGCTVKSESDCEVIIAMYEKLVDEKGGQGAVETMVLELKGEYAFALYDIGPDGGYTLYLASDRLGRRPLFIARNQNTFSYASELRGIPKLKEGTTLVQRFPPRHFAIITRKAGQPPSQPSFRHYYQFPPFNSSDGKTQEGTEIGKLAAPNTSDEKMQEGTEIGKFVARGYGLFRAAVRRRMVADREVACMLSGGLDSSSVAAEAAVYILEQNQKDGGKRVLRTFSGGLPGGTDEGYAKMVAARIGSEHKHYTFTEAEVLAAIPRVVFALGSYDTTSIRASALQFLLCEAIARDYPSVKVILNGDIADEGFGGYAYFHKAPSPQAFHDECIRLLSDIHFFDGLRADRCISHFGMEARFPFGDEDFLDFYLQIPAEFRWTKGPLGPLEKGLFREMMRNQPLLPEQVRQRDKCALSDGCSDKKTPWFAVCQQNGARLGDRILKITKDSIGHNAPLTGEMAYYRELFEKRYGANESVAKTIPYFWLPRWCGHVTDPAARLLTDIHVEKTVEELAKS